MHVRVCYIKDEQKSLRPDADVAIWPFTLIGICVYGLHACVCVCELVFLEGVRRRKWSVFSQLSSKLIFRGLTQYV